MSTWPRWAGPAAPASPCWLDPSLVHGLANPAVRSCVRARRRETGAGPGAGEGGTPCPGLAARLHGYTRLHGYNGGESPALEMLPMTTPSESAEIYCLKCKAKTPSLDVESVVMKNGRPALKGVCAECGTGKYRIGSMR